VMLDADLAALYGVPTKALIQAVRRNRSRFPADFMLRLPIEEAPNLRSQIVTSSSSRGWGGRRYVPHAFTEQGVAMLSSVLRSPRAIAVNITIMRAFVRLRQMLRSHEALARKLDTLEKKYDAQFKVVFDVTTELCQMKRKEPDLKNIYMELGSTFGQLVTTNPTTCAHLLGQVIDTFGADHVLWGTDSIWYGTPQWQIEAFRRFEIPPALVEKHGYAPLTRSAKEQIFGLNAARVFGVDVNARRNEIPKDYLSRMKMAYLEDGAAPSHRWYGWVAG
jgi:hypothetical protein